MFLGQDLKNQSKFHILFGKSIASGFFLMQSDSVKIYAIWVFMKSIAGSPVVYRKLGTLVLGRRSRVDYACDHRFSIQNYDRHSVVFLERLGFTCGTFLDKKCRIDGAYD